MFIVYSRYSFLFPSVVLLPSSLTIFSLSTFLFEFSYSLLTCFRLVQFLSFFSSSLFHFLLFFLFRLSSLVAVSQFYKTFQFFGLTFSLSLSRYSCSNTHYIFFFRYTLDYHYSQFQLIYIYILKNIYQFDTLSNFFP